ncbi:MAG: BBP7 family outer membrane beta-barrel protein [Planctomycetota bacterium]|nr:BBP7 family outer membrane beta-barrel protein [Planctomycetota bacterium]
MLVPTAAIDSVDQRRGFMVLPAGVMVAVLLCFGSTAVAQAPAEVLGTPSALPAAPPADSFPAFPSAQVPGPPPPPAPPLPPLPSAGAGMPSSAPVTSGQVGGGVPLDGGVVPAPMYVPDPSDLGGFAALPQAVATDILPEWPRWFAGASGLIMTRTLPSSTATMQPSAGLTTLTTASAPATWPGGLDFQVGRWMGDRQTWALEGIYWGVYGLGTSATVTGTGIDAIPQAPGVTLAGSPASAFLADATQQQIARSDLVNNVEINWLYRLTDRPEFPSLDGSLGFMWLAGFRFFELQDVLSQTSTSSTLPPSSVGANQSLLSVATNNNLYGAQVGAKADWRIAPRIRLSAVPKFMIGGNAITNTTELTTINGSGATFSGGQPVNVHSTLGVFSWLGSVDSSVAWDVTDRWSVWLGYRVVGVGNIAQADGQWPSTLAAPSALQGIGAGSSTILHGGFAGFQGRY